MLRVWLVDDPECCTFMYWYWVDLDALDPMQLSISDTPVISWSMDYFNYQQAYSL